MCTTAFLPAVSGVTQTVGASMAAGSTASMWSSIGNGLQLAGAVTGAFSAYNSSKATKGAYEYQASVNRNNSQVAEWQAKDALIRGQKSEQTQRLKTAALKSTQKASFAARGVALDEGSPLSILEDTEFLGEMDALTLRDNTAKEAWGYKMQAQNYNSDAGMLSARAEAESPTGSAFNSLLTGAGSVAASWYKRSTKTAGY